MKLLLIEPDFGFELDMNDAYHVFNEMSVW